MSISGIYALTSQVTDGEIKTGVVDIQLQNFELNNNNEEIQYLYDQKAVMPGEVVSFIPKICNLGEKCYVRFKVNYIDNNTNFEEYVTGLSSDFKKYGNYYYYDGVLNPDENLKLFETIKIPNDLSTNSYGGKISIEIVAEAIQEKNFTPDYEENDPWKNIIPTESIKSSFDIMNNSKIIIKYEDDIGSDISVPNNFFEKMKNSMPGDSFTDSVEIRNTNKRNAKYYFQVCIDDKQTIERELLSQCNLTITNDLGQVVYNGKLLNEDKILLGEYNIDDYGKLEYKISIPEELGNEFSLLNPEITLVFSADYEKEKLSVNPKTGDDIDWTITIFFISTMGLIIVMLLVYRENKKEEY